MSRPLALVSVECDLCRRQTDTELVARGRDFDYGTAAGEFTFVRCLACGLVFLDPRPAESELDRIYPASYEPFHFHDSRNPFIRYGRGAVQGLKAKLIRGLVPEDATIVDVGCGSGHLLELLRKQGPPAWRLYGNDFSEVALEQLARAGIGALAGRFEEIETEVRFDLVILNQTIEHLVSPAQVVEKAFELLIPGGRLLIETPSLDGIDAKLFRRGYWGGYHFPRHWTLFTSATLARLVERAGFEVERVDYLASPAFWCQSFQHIVGEHRLTRPLVGVFGIRNPVALAAFTTLDLVLARFRPTSNLRLVARRPLA